MFLKLFNGDLWLSYLSFFFFCIYAMIFSSFKQNGFELREQLQMHCVQLEKDENE